MFQFIEVSLYKHNLVLQVLSLLLNVMSKLNIYTKLFLNEQHRYIIMQLQHYVYDVYSYYTHVYQSLQ